MTVAAGLHLISCRKGLDLPIGGEPEFNLDHGKTVTKVALLGTDYIGLKPTMLVAAGDHVQLGQPLFTDKKNPGVIFTAPGTGTILDIHRGERRRLLSIVIQLDAEESPVTFQQYGDDLSTLNRQQARDQLIQSGMWTVIRTRPYSKVPGPEDEPSSIFVTAIDTNPLAANPEIIIADALDDFRSGLHVLARVADVPLHVCVAADTELDFNHQPNVQQHAFHGPHPAGLPGTHIHFLDPVGPTKTCWHLNYQDVIAIGSLFRTGQLDTGRTISLAGPAVQHPRLIRTRVGACIADLVQDELEPNNGVRIISGSVLSGRNAEGPQAYLGRYHLQVSALREETQREFLGWQRPGMNKFSVQRVFASALLGRQKRFDFTTSTEGSPRAMVPIGSYEKVMPLDILPTFLLRALIVGDTEQAQLLGCLELDEEDVALCTFVCPGKYNYGSLLRKNLAQIEEEG